ncbi:MAG: tripartite tricarboxylate transporter substrate binding protein, partial [Reyranella sp.]|nr:tripartite tricarboxylate transporter substrate binding protein [Reyranella sp.]
PLPISTLKRSPCFPEHPTVAESSDLNAFDVVFWQGLVVPAGTPKPIQDKLHATIAKITAEPEVIERFKKQGVEIRSSTPAQFKEWYLLEEKRWVTLIKEQNLKAE